MSGHGLCHRDRLLLLHATHSDTVTEMDIQILARLLRQFCMCGALLGLLISGCVDAVPADGRGVFLVGMEPELAPTGGILRLYGHGLATSPDPIAQQDELDRADVDSSNCQFPDEANAVLFDGTESEVCYRAFDRIDVRVPVVSPGAHYVVVRSGGQLSNALVVYVAQ